MEEDKIISYFLDISNDISMMGRDSKFSFLYKFKKNKYNKKLISMIDKLRESNLTLDYNNILELVSSIHATYGYSNENSRYGAIYKIIYNSVVDEYIIHIKEKEFDCIIAIGGRIRKNKFNINISNKIRSYNVELYKLDSDIKEIKEYLAITNKILLDTMCNYISDNLYKENEV